MAHQDRVLIVEDDMAALFALKRLFRGQGWDVSFSRSVKGALEQLGSPPDWIVLDLELIDGRGEDVLRHVREAKIPSRVAVVSGRIGPENLIRLKPLMPDAMLEKPIQFDDLLKICDG